MRKRADVSIPTLDVNAVVTVLEDAPVTVGILYGSHARGDATAMSDIDLAVEFDESISSVERTRARLSLIERLSTTIGTDEIDVTPLSRIPTELLEDIRADGVLLYGSMAELDRYEGRSVEPTTRRNRLAEFDALLAELERVV